ncbi:hypothetical protein RIF29_07087 [Crotalaria pallida]|uniref:Uncharacterized protein n=1 Tax=Crotalaria pallida TaxID=3830 RepID=A0AAN9J3U2_CROPI
MKFELQRLSSMGKGTGGTLQVKCPPNGQVMSESDGGLPLVTVPPAEFNKENGVIWACSPDRLELPSKPYHSNCSDSPCVSESGSDIFSKREVIQKLRQQLKRRDERGSIAQGSVLRVKIMMVWPLQTKTGRKAPPYY